MPSDGRYPGETEEAHPEVFTVAPPFQGDLKPGQFTEQQRKQFFEEGFVIVEDFVPREILDAVRSDIEILLETLAQKLYKAGKISKLYQNEGLFTRLNLIEKEFPGANILLHKFGVMPPAFRALWSHEKFLNLSEQLLGTTEIQGHPVWNLRTKTPKNEATIVPWHQDVAYLDNTSYDVMHVSAWIPFLDTDETNGCMQMMRGGHRSGKVATHQCCHGGTWYVMLEEDEMRNKLGIDTEKDRVTCPVPYGGAVIFNNLIPHRSLNNVSKQTRWTMDLRWLRADKPIGFHGLKDGIKLGSADPDFEIDWEPFNAVDRQKRAAEQLNQSYEEFDTTIHGPWMHKWEIVHMNHHTAGLLKADGDSSRHSDGMKP